MLKEKDMWQVAARPFLDKFPLDKIKPFIKVLYYKALNGENIRYGVGDHSSLKALMELEIKSRPLPSDESLEARLLEVGVDIIDSCPVLRELELFIKTVFKLELVRPWNQTHP